MPLEDARAAHPKNIKRNNNNNTSLPTAPPGLFLAQQTQRPSSLNVDSVVSAIRPSMRRRSSR